jgi:Rab9 effector protein with kelch motifs
MGVYDISRKCRVCYNSINLVDLQTWTSRTLKMGNEESIEGRRNHGAALLGKYMLVIGGINTKREFLNDFIYLDLKELKWYHK